MNMHSAKHVGEVLVGKHELYGALRGTNLCRSNSFRRNEHM